MKRTRLALLALLLAAGCVEDPRTDPQTHGVLAVESVPPGARIIVDGTLTPDLTPHTYVNMPAGERIIRLTLAGFQSSYDRILVPRSEERRVGKECRL